MINNPRNLRLGNWLLYGDVWVPILTLDLHDETVVVNKMLLRFYEGIPIDEKLLERCGFEFYEYELIDSEDLPDGYTVGESGECLFQWYRKYKNELIYYGIELHPSGRHCFYKTMGYQHRSNKENDIDMSVIGYVEYLHELQNMFFICFEEELEIVNENK